MPANHQRNIRSRGNDTPAFWLLWYDDGASGGGKPGAIAPQGDRMPESLPGPLVLLVLTAGNVRPVGATRAA
jgi:hypothetical protein